MEAHEKGEEVAEVRNDITAGALTDNIERRAFTERTD